MTQTNSKPPVFGNSLAVLVCVLLAVAASIAAQLNKTPASGAASLQSSYAVGAILGSIFAAVLFPLLLGWVAYWIGMRSTKAARIVACIVALLIAAGGVGQLMRASRIVPSARAPGNNPPDKSLTTTEYIDLGFPAPDRSWAGEDVARAGQLITKLGKDGALPRHESPKSGVLFSRMTSPQNVEGISENPDVPLASRLSDSLALIEGANAMLKIYMNAASDGHAGSRELIEISGFQLRVSASMATRMEELLPTISKDDPKYEARMAGVKQTRGGLASVVAGTLTTLGERHFYSSADCKALLPHMGASFPIIFASLEENSKRETLRRMDEMIADPAHSDIKADLSAIRDTLNLK